MSTPHVPGYERVVLLENDGDRRPNTDVWHTDLTFKQKPPFASILYAKAVPACGGDTLWCSMYAAYDALPAGMKADLRDLSAGLRRKFQIPSDLVVKCQTIDIVKVIFS
jgi:taurine dioxygenase